METTKHGLIKRSNEESFFLRFHEDSQLSKSLFTVKPKYDGDYVKVLQIMLTNEGYVLAECVKL